MKKQQHEVYPLFLTTPDNIPQHNTDPHPLPPVASSRRLHDEALAQMQSILANPAFGTNTCARCQATLEILKFISLAAPEQGPDLVVALCQLRNLSRNCQEIYNRQSLGSVITQVLANGDIGGYDGQVRPELDARSLLNLPFQAFCHNFLGMCPLPPTSPLDVTGWFAKPKPNPLPIRKQSSGRRLKVLHMSDFHLDPSIHSFPAW